MALQIRATHSSVMALDSYPRSAMADVRHWCERADAWAAGDSCLSAMVSEITARLERIAR